MERYYVQKDKDLSKSPIPQLGGTKISETEHDIECKILVPDSQTHPSIYN